MANDDLPLKLIFTRWYNSIREWILDDINQLLANTIVGGKLVGSKVSGTIPTGSVPYSSATPAGVGATAVVGTATSGANHADHVHPMGIITSKGDFLGHDGSTAVRVAVGTDTYVPVADSTQTPGWKWAPVSGTGSSTLAGDTDVSIISPAASDHLLYQTSDSKWHNHAEAFNVLAFGAVADWKFVSDGVTTNTSTTVTSATASFTSNDVGKHIAGSGIPTGATISSVTNSTTVVISSAATATASSVLISWGTDNTSAFNAAVDAAVAADGGVILYPPGNYGQMGTVTLGPSENVRVEFRGYGATVWVDKSQNGIFFDNIAGDGTGNGCTISGLTFYGIYGTTGNADGIHIHDTSFVNIRDCRCWGMSSGIHLRVTSYQAESIAIEGCFVNGNTTGVNFDGSGTQSFDNCSIRNTGVGTFNVTGISCNGQMYRTWMDNVTIWVNNGGSAATGLVVNCDALGSIWQVAMELYSGTTGISVGSSAANLGNFDLTYSYLTISGSPTPVSCATGKFLTFKQGPVIIQAPSGWAGSTRYSWAGYVTGDTQPRWAVDGDAAAGGRWALGPGGSTVADVLGWRSAAGELSLSQVLKIIGATGATGGGRIVGTNTSGAPASGTFSTGDLAWDNAGKVWICTAGGSPGTWVSSGSAAISGLTDVSEANLANDDGLLYSTVDSKWHNSPFMERWHEHVYQEDLTAQTDSATTTFILAQEFQPSTTQVFKNGSLQRPGSGNDYTEDSTMYDAIIFTSAPTSGDKVIVQYVTA